MAKPITKEELENENKALKDLVKSLSENQTLVIDSSIKLIKESNKVTRRYHTNIHKIDRAYIQKLNALLIFILLVNTMLLLVKYM